MSSAKDLLKRATQSALKNMRDAGFGISDDLKVSVDPNLPFMGYSTAVGRVDSIVVAGRALESGMIEGLLIHEMSHIYRTKTNHPSHNRELLNRVGRFVIDKNRLIEEYQIATVQESVNHVQDLYADDIAFKVFSDHRIFPPDQAFRFFLSWISDKPVDLTDLKTVWLNLRAMLNNCFVLSNMIRHGVPDVNNKAEKKVRRFLSQTSERMKTEYLYFRDFMTNLKENVSEKQFEKDLTDYLTRIVELANQSASDPSLTRDRAPRGFVNGEKDASALN